MSNIFDVRDVCEDGGSYHWPDSPPASMRPDARPVAPHDDTSLQNALSAPMVGRWISVTPADPADPRSVSMHVHDGIVHAGPKSLHGAKIHDICSVGGTTPHAHARDRIPLRATDHPDFAIAKRMPASLGREATSYALHAALAQVPGRTTGHVGSQRPADRAIRPGTGDGEVDLSPSGGRPVMETTGHVESTGAAVPGDEGHRWLTFTRGDQARGARAVHAFAGHDGSITKGPHGLLGARHEHLSAMHEITTVTHRRGVRPKGYDHQQDYAESGRPVRRLSRAEGGLGLLQALNVAEPAAYNGGQIATEPDSDDTPANTTAAASTSAPVVESVTNVGAKSGRGYTAPVAVAHTAPVRETTGAVVGGAFRQYRATPAPRARAKAAAYVAPDYPAYTRGIAIAARESDTALVVAVCSGCPDAGDGADARRLGGRALGAVQGIGHDDAVAARVQEQLAAWQPAHLVTILSSPADLLLCEAAKGLHVSLALVMPASEAATRGALVGARGEAWGGRFDRLLAHVRASGGSVFQRIGPDAAAGRCLNEALAVARQHVGIGQQPAGFVRAFVVSDGAGGPPIARDLARSALVAGVETTTITVAGFGGGGVL